MEPCSQDSRIGKIEKAVERIETTVNELRTDYSQVKAKVNEALEKVRGHDDALNGLGKEGGVIVRVSDLVEGFEEIKMMLKGKGEDPGMAGTLKSIKEALDKREDTEKWLFRLIGAYIFLELVKATLPIIVSQGN
ncbi:MAG TPA: hypothetical protein VFF68_04545 [Anaerolineaceae bacterium]|nr:hypothetical protein [Anaerolineaceae bacterium]